MPRREDSVLRSSRREAISVAVVWIVAMTWTIAYCGKYGYDRDPATMTYVWGVPDWVFWGVFAPWAGCYVFAFILSYVLMTDADLGEVRELPADEPAHRVKPGDESAPRTLSPDAPCGGAGFQPAGGPEARPTAQFPPADPGPPPGGDRG